MKESIIEQGRRRWPHFARAIHPDHLLPHMNQWLLEQGPAATAESCRDEMIRWLREQLADAPKEEILDIMLEQVATTILKTIAEKVLTARKDGYEAN